jgi:short-subunit dehydrogenase
VNNNGIHILTKFAVNGFSECMEKYLLKCKIHVTTLCPGSTATSWWDRWTHPFGREAVMPPDCIADIVELILNTPDNVLFRQLRVLPDAEVDIFWPFPISIIVRIRVEGDGEAAMEPVYSLLRPDTEALYPMPRTAVM